MSKFKAPDNTSGFSVEGQSFDVVDGFVEMPLQTANHLRALGVDLRDEDQIDLDTKTPPTSIVDDTQNPPADTKTTEKTAPAENSTKIVSDDSVGAAVSTPDDTSAKSSKNASKSS